MHGTACSAAGEMEIRLRNTPREIWTDWMGLPLRNSGLREMGTVL